MTAKDAFLKGGPADGRSVPMDGSPSIELQIDGVLHRYIKTKEKSLDQPVYAYDGPIDPAHSAKADADAED